MASASVGVMRAPDVTFVALLLALVQNEQSY